MAIKVEMHSTYMWQEMKRYPHYRIQTNDPRVAKKLMRRKSCTLALHGINAKLWVFRTKYSSPNKALFGLNNITHADVEETAEKGVFVSYTQPVLHPETEEEVEDGE